MERVVAVTILIVELQPRADFETVFRRDRHVPLIKQSVQVGAKEDTVANIVRAVLRVRLDVRSLQRGRECSWVTAHARE